MPSNSCSDSVCTRIVGDRYRRPQIVAWSWISVVGLLLLHIWTFSMFDTPGIVVEMRCTTRTPIQLQTWRQNRVFIERLKKCNKIERVNATTECHLIDLFGLFQEHLRNNWNKYCEQLWNGCCWAVNFDSADTGGHKYNQSKWNCTCQVWVWMTDRK